MAQHPTDLKEGISQLARLIQLSGETDSQFGVVGSRKNLFVEKLYTRYDLASVVACIHLCTTVWRQSVENNADQPPGASILPVPARSSTLVP